MSGSIMMLIIGDTTLNPKPSIAHQVPENLAVSIPFSISGAKGVISLNPQNYTLNPGC